MNDRLKADGGVAAGAERGLKEITDHLPGAVYRLRISANAGVKLVYVSEGIGNLVGVEKLEAESDIRALFSLVVPEDLAGLQEAIGIVSNEVREISYDFRFRHTRTGEVRWLRSRAAPFRDIDGTVVADGLWQDITDIKELEVALEHARDKAQRAEQRLREITDQLPGMVYQTQLNPDLSTQFNMISDGVRELYGLTPDELMSDATLIQRMVDKEDLPRIWKAQLDALRSREPVSYDFRVHRWDGTLRWHRTTASPCVMENGVATWNGFTVDITTQKELEAELKALRDKVSKP
jgi:two-component system, sensor histidine kinase and response regulator